MLRVCSTHSLITGCDFIESRRLNIVLTLSDVNVGAEALSGWLKSVDSAIGAYNEKYANKRGMLFTTNY